MVIFQKLLRRAEDNISTVRSVIQTNENIRKVIFGYKNVQQQSIDCQQLLDLIQKDIPKPRDWKIYDHCAAVTKLYAIYENFVEDLIRDWLSLLPEICPNYNDLEEIITKTHQLGAGRLLIDLNKKRYKHLSFEDVVNSLHSGIDNSGSYELLADAFLFHEQNLRKDTLNKLLADAGINDSWLWIEQHTAIRDFVAQGSQNTAEGELNELIVYRNDAAHTTSIDNSLGFNALLELCTFTESICQALTDLFTYKVIEKKAKIGKAKYIGKITEWFKKPQAGVARVSKISLSIELPLFLVNENIAWCKPAIVKSIKIDEKSVGRTEYIEEEMEIGLKFDIDAKKDLNLYILNE
ncbi:MAG: MAE_28990/MAE_18760 family HEPN-like nuclease [Microcoleaceae cyanobacterium]